MFRRKYVVKTTNHMAIQENLSGWVLFLNGQLTAKRDCNLLYITEHAWEYYTCNCLLQVFMKSYFQNVFYGNPSYFKMLFLKNSIVKTSFFLHIMIMMGLVLMLIFIYSII
jgi:hypothetical protein